MQFVMIIVVVVRCTCTAYYSIWLPWVFSVFLVSTIFWTKVHRASLDRLKKRFRVISSRKPTFLSSHKSKYQKQSYLCDTYSTLNDSRTQWSKNEKTRGTLCRVARRQMWANNYYYNMFAENKIQITRRHIRSRTHTPKYCLKCLKIFTIQFSVFATNRSSNNLFFFSKNVPSAFEMIWIACYSVSVAMAKSVARKFNSNSMQMRNWISWANEIGFNDRND